ncbi:DUF948 domain-containing protein [Candidatus Poribacteria bacterium]|nr:DUF948 domain-containing protein [Candidatus Poribacteria bacterium]
MDWNFYISLFWQCSLGIALIALTILVIYLCKVLGSLRNSLSTIQNTLNSTEKLVNNEIGTLITDATQTIKVINAELPELLQNINGVTASIQQISENEIQPTIHNIQELTLALSKSIKELESLVELVSTFSGDTINQAEYFRNQVAESLADVVGLWHGLKAGWDRIYKSTHSNGKPQTNTENGDSETVVQEIESKQDDSDNETQDESE